MRAYEGLLFASSISTGTTQQGPTVIWIQFSQLVAVACGGLLYSLPKPTRRKPVFEHAKAALENGGIE